MKVTVITAHAPDARRKTGFHFWAELLTNKGIDFDWVTVGFSPITILKGQRDYKKPYNVWIKLSPHLRKFTWCPLIHPFNTGSFWLNKFLTPFFSIYAYLLPQTLKEGIKDTNIFIIEGGSGLMLTKTLAELCPKAKLVYCVSDRIKTLNFHPVITKAEDTSLPYFSKVQVPAIVMKDDFPASAPVEFIPQGIDKALFDNGYANPYDRPRNVISVGDMLFDSGTVEILAKNFPDWSFHLFGLGAKLTRSFSNVTEYGEQPFEKLIPYLVHADIGLAPYLPATSADYLSQSSLKMVQYTYCQLPIVGPLFAATGRPHVMAYPETREPNEVINAFEMAIVFDRNKIDRSQVFSWEQVLEKIMHNMSPTEIRKSQ